MTDWPADLPPHISLSQIRLYEEKPDAYRLRYLHEQRDPAQGFFVLGDAIHDALTWGFRQKMELDTYPPVGSVIGKTYPPVGPVIEEFAVALNKRTAEAGGGEVEWGKSSYEQAQNTGCGLVGLYWRLYSPTIKPIALEKEITLDIGCIVPLRGYIDLETPEYIIDWKSAARAVTFPSRYWKLQARLYQLEVFKPMQYHVLAKTNKPAVYTPKENQNLEIWPDGSDPVTKYVNTVCKSIIAMYNTFGPDEQWVGWWK